MRLRNLRFLIAVFAATICCFSWTSTGQASLFALNGNVTTPSGTFGVDVSASLASSGDTLTIQLTNKLATPDPSVVLTDVDWSLNAEGTHPSLTLKSIAYGSATALFTTASASSTPALITTTYNMWGLAEHPNGQLGQGSSTFFTNEYGVSAIGGGIFNGNHGSISSPKSGLNGDDYGIVGPGTNLSQTNLNNKLPLVKNTGSGDSSLIFTITGFSGFNASQVTDVHFSFGSEPTLAAANAVPEPSTLAIAGLGALGFVAYGMRRRKAT
jgi:hypothetical protein